MEDLLPLAAFAAPCEYGSDKWHSRQPSLLLLEISTGGAQGIRRMVRHRSCRTQQSRLHIAALLAAPPLFLKLFVRD